MLGETDRTMDTLDMDHLKLISNAKTIQLQEDRNTEVERENRILFEKIEKIISRQGPYKKQQSINNKKKLAKVFHVPSDNTVTASTYIPRQTYNMAYIKQEQRNVANRKLQEENQKVLDRIVGSKPSINVDEFIKHGRAYD